MSAWEGGRNFGRTTLKEVYAVVQWNCVSPHPSLTHNFDQDCTDPLSFSVSCKFASIPFLTHFCCETAVGQFGEIVTSVRSESNI